MGRVGGMGCAKGNTHAMRKEIAMLRGTKRDMIVVRTRDSRLFEEAYFVMRRNAGKARPDELDMLWEANRILESSLPARGPLSEAKVPPSAFGLVRGLIWFGLGALCGGGGAALLFLLL